MIPLFDGRIIRKTESLLIHLEMWTALRVDFWLKLLITVGCSLFFALIWIADAFYSQQKDVGLIDLIALFSMGGTGFIIPYVPDKALEVELADRTQQPVKASTLTFHYCLVLRLFCYLLTACLIVRCFAQGCSAYELGCFGLLFLEILIYLVASSDVYPSTGGRKLKDLFNAITRSFQPQSRLAPVPHRS